MLTKRKKLTKKEIKEDKLVEFYYKAQNYFEENQSKVLMYAGVLVVVVIAVIFYLNHKNSQNEEAGVKLARVMDFYDAGAYLEAIEGRQGTNIVGLKGIVEEYGGTENGEIAKIYLANAYSMLGQYDKAYEFYEDYGGDIELFKSTALAGQAGYYAVKGEYQKAADYYFQAANVSKDNVQRPDYLLQAGINYLNAGDKEDAKNLFQMIKDDYKTSTAFTQVDRYLVQTN